MDKFTNKTIEKLKYDLVREGLISYEQLENAQEIAKVQSVNVAQALIKMNLLTEQSLLSFIEDKLHIPFVELENYSLDTKCLKYVSFNDAIKYRVIPLFKIEKSLTVAMSDPLDLFAIDKIVEAIDEDSEFEIDPVLASDNAIQKKIEEYYNTNSSVGNIKGAKDGEEIDWTKLLHEENLSEEHIKVLIQTILKQAIYSSCHELYFEYVNDELSVVFKKASETAITGNIPSILASAFVSRIKSLSGLDPSLSEVPQLGKLCFKLDDVSLIASVSSFPTIIGERIALKIYKPPKKFSEYNLSLVEKQFLLDTVSNSGIILVCGSALSGKTHFIYSLLSEIADSDNFEKTKNLPCVMTIESIAKYNLKNVNQCELNESIGFNLEKAMKYIEFQNPDVIYFEGISSKLGLDFFASLVYNNRTIITEFMVNSVEELQERLSSQEFSLFKTLIKAIVFIHSKDTIEIMSKEAIKKYLQC